MNLRPPFPAAMRCRGRFPTFASVERILDPAGEIRHPSAERLAQPKLRAGAFEVFSPSPHLEVPVALTVIVQETQSQHEAHVRRSQRHGL